MPIFILEASLSLRLDWTILWFFAQSFLHWQPFCGFGSPTASAIITGSFFSQTVFLPLWLSHLHYRYWASSCISNCCVRITAWGFPFTLLFFTNTVHSLSICFHNIKCVWNPPNPTDPPNPPPPPAFLLQSRHRNCSTPRIKDLRLKRTFQFQLIVFPWVYNVWHSLCGVKKSCFPVFGHI